MARLTEQLAGNLSIVDGLTLIMFFSEYSEAFSAFDKGEGLSYAIIHRINYSRQRVMGQ